MRAPAEQISTSQQPGALEGKLGQDKRLLGGKIHIGGLVTHGKLFLAEGRSKGFSRLGGQVASSGPSKMLSRC